jgi:hypothetical protein
MDKSKMRARLTSLSFSEKIKILEKLRDRDRVMATSGLRRKAAPVASKQAGPGRKD